MPPSSTGSSSKPSSTGSSSKPSSTGSSSPKPSSKKGDISPTYSIGSPLPNLSFKKGDSSPFPHYDMRGNYTSFDELSRTYPIGRKLEEQKSQLRTELEDVLGIINKATDDNSNRTVRNTREKIQLLGEGSESLYAHNERQGKREGALLEDRSLRDRQKMQSDATVNANAVANLRPGTALNFLGEAVVHGDAYDPVSQARSNIARLDRSDATKSLSFSNSGLNFFDNAQRQSIQREKAQWQSELGRLLHQEGEQRRRDTEASNIARAMSGLNQRQVEGQIADGIHDRFHRLATQQHENTAARKALSTPLTSNVKVVEENNTIQKLMRMLGGW